MTLRLISADWVIAQRSCQFVRLLVQANEFEKSQLETPLSPCDNLGD